MNHSAPWSAPARTTRRIPSPPIPRCRSQIQATVSAVRCSRSPGSGKITKSLPVPCPLANCMNSMLWAGAGVQRPAAQFGGGAVQPDDSRVAPEPRLLPPREPPRGLDGLGHGLLLRPVTIEEGEHLGVPERPARGPALAQARLGQPPHLRDQAKVPHPADPDSDPAVKLRAGQVDAELDGREGGLILRQRRCEGT